MGSTSGMQPDLSHAEAAAGQSAAPPRLVAWLGYGGLLPFLAPLLWGALGGPIATARAALFAYAAVILSFVGALHWAFAMTLPALTPRQREVAFAWSVVPAWMAWLALLSPVSIAVALLLAGFALHLGQDLRFAPRADLPRWYVPLRVRLSLIACLAIGVGGLTLR
jgi:hypothetical protein